MKQLTLSGRTFALCATIPLVALMAGCGGDNAATGGTETPEAQGAPADTEAATTLPAGATGVSGKVTFSGPQPERAVLETEGDPKCYVLHADDPLLSDREVVGPDGGVQWSFVYIKNPPKRDYEIPSEPVVLDQKGCQYSPHVLGVMAGQNLSIANGDPTLHNVRAIARENRPFNISLPEGYKARTKTFDNPEHAMRMKCDVHPWMTGFVFVMPHPYFAVTDASGQFAIADLPPGTYTVVAWHELYGEQESRITVTDGTVSVTNFTFNPVSE